MEKRSHRGTGMTVAGRGPRGSWPHTDRRGTRLNPDQATVGVTSGRRKDPDGYSLRKVVTGFSPAARQP